MRADQITDPLAEHGEGPVWWGPWGGLKYVDMLTGDVLSLHEGGHVSRVHVGSVAAALRPRVQGGAIVAVERAFALAEADDLSDITPLPDIWPDTTIRFNDGGCDPDGRFYCGTMAYDEAPGAGKMFRITPTADGGYATDEVWAEVTISNGFAFSPDGTTAYYNDTPTRRTDVFDYDPGRGLTDRGPLVRLGADDEGNPDGLCVDSEGYVWVAMWSGSAVRRYAPDGRLDGVVELPVTRVTACTFGGADLDTLFITTSRTGIPEGEQPAAGALFSVNPGVTGLAALPFNG
ncbi:MAG: SMP-30/gluconolactonase/LRE family protein [Nocardioidaceae bacterium]